MVGLRGAAFFVYNILMYARIDSAATLGIDAYIVTVETDIAPHSMAKLYIVGLPDAAVKEAAQRVYTAVRNTDFKFPFLRVTVNLAPADTPKEGAAFDLPIAVSILIANGDIPAEKAEGLVFIGELGLDGKLRPVSGILPIALAARKEGRAGVVVPRENAPEAALVEDLPVYAVESLEEVALFLSGARDIPRFTADEAEIWGDRPDYPIDFADVRGQEHAKRALEIASAGSHNVIMVGTPGGGKTMLARRLPSILPDLSREECLDVTKIYSINGMLGGNLVRTRPFRSPHHTISNIALVGGGSVPRPGEVSLAHHGVLFLDELTEFKRDVLEALRQPLEDGVVTIARASCSLTFPASFMLIAAMNPCPCGWYGDYNRQCICNAFQIQKYLKRVSGPLLDRIDIHIEVPRIDPEKLLGPTSSEPSSAVRDRAAAAREMQRHRYEGHNIFNNAELTPRLMKKFCALPAEAEDLLKNAIVKFGFTARAYDRIRKLSRTIADLAGRDNITLPDIAEAIQLRTLDRKYWG